MTCSPALVLAVHGSAAPEAAATVGRLCEAVELTGGVRPVVGHLDVQRPSLGEVLDTLAETGPEPGTGPGSGTGAVGPAAGPGFATGFGPGFGPDSGCDAVVVPLLLGDGYHRTVDLPAVVAAPRRLRSVLTDGLSGERELALALYGRLRQAECRAGGRADAVVLAAAGSSRPGGNDGALTAAAHLRALIAVEHGAAPVVPAYCTSAGPTVPQAVERLRAAGHRRIAVATHLLAPGRFTEALARAGAWTVTDPLADHPRTARIVLRRYKEAVADSARASTGASTGAGAGAMSERPGRVATAGQLV